jgi:hypothetical protein
MAASSDALCIETVELCLQPLKGFGAHTAALKQLFGSRDLRARSRGVSHPAASPVAKHGTRTYTKARKKSATITISINHGTGTFEKIDGPSLRLFVTRSNASDLRN